MAIQQKVMYDRQLDKVFGLVDMGPEQQSCSTPEVANRLLCFVLRGLLTAYVITVGYFFTRCLRSEQLRSMTMNVIKAVEDVGFRVTRIVTGNHQSNVALFKSLSEDGMLPHVVPHPLRQDNNFRYVLTRALNSGPVESLFSCFRPFNGGNDRVDARTAVLTAEKLLKVYLVPVGEHTHVTYALFSPGWNPPSC
ncbi:hypothetical protein MRX96_028953 [Rhipicephalus microplus]